MTYQAEQEPYVALRTKALESLLIEKGLLTAAAVDERVSQYEQDIGPLIGAARHCAHRIHRADACRNRPCVQDAKGNQGDEAAIGTREHLFILRPEDGLSNHRSADCVTRARCRPLLAWASRTVSAPILRSFAQSHRAAISRSARTALQSRHPRSSLACT